MQMTPEVYDFWYDLTKNCCLLEFEAIKQDSNYLLLAIGFQGTNRYAIEVKAIEVREDSIKFRGYRKGLELYEYVYLRPFSKDYYGLYWAVRYLV